MLNEIAPNGSARMYIGGEWVTASDGAEITVLDPSTADVVASVPSGSVDDARDAVTAAADASSEWAATAPRARADVLRGAYELMVARADQIAELIVLEMGKTFPEARGETLFAAELLRWFSEEAVRINGSVATAPGGDKKIMAIHQPIGVSVLITPWNFPASMVTRKIGPAFAAGCTVVLKPASDTPLTALALAKVFQEAGAPAGTVNVLPSRRSAEVGEAMLTDPRVRNLSFTGSTEVGRQLLEVASRHVLRGSMELGGNAPFLVFEDADIEAAVSGAMIAKMRNGGQSCVAANRILVHASVADEFSRQFSAAMETVKTGPGMETGVELGPMINAGAQEEMKELVGVSTAAGSSVATGGDAPTRPGFFFKPTVLTGVDLDNPILGREIFGPLAPVIRFESEEEAVQTANDTEYGLAAYVYTEDLKRGMRVAESIETGMVGINRGLVTDAAAPFGGVKESGLGRESGSYGIFEFLETKYIAADW